MQESITGNKLVWPMGGAQWSQWYVVAVRRGADGCMGGLSVPGLAGLVIGPVALNLARKKYGNNAAAGLTFIARTTLFQSGFTRATKACALLAKAVSAASGS